MEALAKGHTVYLRDLPGHGPSRGTPWDIPGEFVCFLEALHGRPALSAIPVESMGALAWPLRPGTPPTSPPLCWKTLPGLDDRAGFLRFIIPWHNRTEFPDKPPAPQHPMARQCSHKAHVTDRLVSLIHTERTAPGNQAPPCLKMLRGGSSFLRDDHHMI